MKLYNKLLRKIDDFKIQRQRQYLEEIYSGIRNKIQVCTLRDKYYNLVPREVKSILDKLCDIGYLELDIINNKSSLRVSVVIPHYNQNVFLKDALEGLARQSTLPDEVIIVDDSSDNYDTVIEVVNAYKAKLKIKLYKPEKKLYAGFARQYGAEKANGDIIIYHDADDISHQNRVELTKYFFMKNNKLLQFNIGYYSFSNQFYDILRDFQHLEAEKNTVPVDYIWEEMKDKLINQKYSSFKSYGIRAGSFGYSGNFGCQAGHVACRKEVVSKLKWTSPTDYTFTKYEDYDFNFMLFLSGQNIIQIDLPLVYYRIGSSSNLVNYLGVLDGF